MAMMKVLGVDAAFSNFGIAFGSIDVSEAPRIEPRHIRIESLQLVTTKPTDKETRKVVRKSSDDLRRARAIVAGIREACEKHQPTLIAVEVPSGAQSARAASTLGMVVGILGSIDIPLVEVTQREVKEATGDKLADKIDIINWAMALYPDAGWVMQKRGGKLIQVSSTNEHLADAVAAIHAAIATEEVRRFGMFVKSMRAGAGDGVSAPPRLSPD